MIAKFEDGRVRTEVRDGKSRPGQRAQRPRSGAGRSRRPLGSRRPRRSARPGRDANDRSDRVERVDRTERADRLDLAGAERPPLEPEFLDIRGGGRRDSPCHHRDTRSPECQTAVLPLIAVLLGLVFLHLASSAPVGAQARPNQPSAPSIEDRPVIDARAAEREHFQLKIGPSYDEGDFGTSQKTRTFFFPFTLRYLGERVGPRRHHVVRPARRARHTSSSSTPAPEHAGGCPGRARSTRVSVTWSSRAATTSWTIPARLVAAHAAPFLKLKLPTADENKGLCTGEVDWGFGLEWDKTFGAFFIYGDASYTFMG